MIFFYSFECGRVYMICFRWWKMSKSHPCHFQAETCNSWYVLLSALALVWCYERMFQMEIQAAWDIKLHMDIQTPGWLYVRRKLILVTLSHWDFGVICSCSITWPVLTSILPLNWGFYLLSLLFRGSSCSLNTYVPGNSTLHAVSHLTFTTIWRESDDLTLLQ